MDVREALLDLLVARAEVEGKRKRLADYGESVEAEVKSLRAKFEADVTELRAAVKEREAEVKVAEKELAEKSDAVYDTYGVRLSFEVRGGSTRL